MAWQSSCVRCLRWSWKAVRSENDRERQCKMVSFGALLLLAWWLQHLELMMILALLPKQIAYINAG